MWITPTPSHRRHRTGASLLSSRVHPSPDNPSPSQLRAIEALPGALLVLAGPGAGKTFCLTERIRFLIEAHGFDPSRVCAFTFTNKAAGEIANRLQSRLGSAAERITRGTIHAFCAKLLREFGAQVGLASGFGIADEDYQLRALRRIQGPQRWHRQTLTAFAAYRFRGDPLRGDDVGLFDAYERFLADRNLLDFDSLVLRAAELFELTPAAEQIRARWDVVLVDEFQDLNPVQYQVVSALAHDHRHVFAVGDDEQSIYSWAGADPKVFRSFVNDFGIVARIHLEENRRCPHTVFALARQLINVNTPLFEDRVIPRSERASPFPVRALSFSSEVEECEWLVRDIVQDRQVHSHSWGDVAVLYRRHEIGNALEAALLNAAVPCRLARGRALAEDPIVRFAIAALRVIASPDDDVVAEGFFRAVLPRPLCDEVVAKATERGVRFHQQLQRMGNAAPIGDGDGRKMRRALAEWRNLAGTARQHTTLDGLIQDLLSRRVGTFTSVLEDHHDELSDPAGFADVTALAERLARARERGAAVWIEPMAGVEIGLRGILEALNIRVVLGADPPLLTPRQSGADHPGQGGFVPEDDDAPTDYERISAADVPSVGIAVGVFKAAQLLAMANAQTAFRNFTAVDLETTDNDRHSAQIIEIAALRVRDGVIVEEFHSLVKPTVAISAGARDTHGIGDDEVANAPSFADVWPSFRAFCGDDMVVAHNGYHFDFRIIGRQAGEIGASDDLCTFDSLPLARELFATSCALPYLAEHFGVATGRSHRALDDTRTLAHVFLKLADSKASRSRKTALVNVLDYLGVALALSDETTLDAEAKRLRDLSRIFALGRFTDCLDVYERASREDMTLPSVEELIQRLGGWDLMQKLRTTRSADERYPIAMARLRRILEEISPGTLEEQLAEFLDRVVLSSSREADADPHRVNLLTLHSTKGLEFSRVYIVGAEDSELPGNSPTRSADSREVEEARRLLYVGMTRTIDRLVLTRVDARDGRITGGCQFLTEMGLVPERIVAGASP
jgi:superfamily I DNA/RNA helicase